MTVKQTLQAENEVQQARGASALSCFERHFLTECQDEVRLWRPLTKKKELFYDKRKKKP
jgi:hypothetical protein